MDVPLRVGFAGTPDFAVAALEAILAAGFDVPLVLTRPDRPKGRGLVLQPSAVKAVAVARGLRVRQPASLKDSEAQEALRAVPLDVLVVAAYGLLLPQAVLDWPARGALNIHASLLPRWRGAAPIERAILAGDATTGITIMQMDAGLDTGPMIERVALPIGPRETADGLRNRLAVAGGEAIVRVLRRLPEGALVATPQPEAGATYAAKIDRREAQIDWSRPAEEVDRLVRAFHPAPGATTRHDGIAWKVLESEPVAEGRGHPGTVLHAAGDDLVVACGQGALRVRALQPAGGRRLSAREVVSGRRWREGSVLGSPGAPPASARSGPG